jgi:hypothetical protein
MIAVFQRLDLSTLTSILGQATEDHDLELLSFVLQPASGDGTVPDAEISSGFHFLFEIKTAYGAVNEVQLRGHLKHLPESRSLRELLIAVSPDYETPAAVLALEADGAPVKWFSFSALHRVIETVVAEQETIRDDERLLLRELQTLLDEEGLLGRQDTVIVAAGLAHGFYKKHHAYVCQQGRSFRSDLTQLGFYRKRRIEREVPRILYVEDNVPFDLAEATRRRALNDPFQNRVADVIQASLASGERADGAVHKVFILSPPDAAETVELAEPLPHEGEGAGSAFTMGQRYVYLQDLKTAKSTADLR